MKNKEKRVNATINSFIDQSMKHEIKCDEEEINIEIESDQEIFDLCEHQQQTQKTTQKPQETQTNTIQTMDQKAVNQQICDENDGIFGPRKYSKKSYHGYSANVIFLCLQLLTNNTAEQIPNILRDTLKVYTNNNHNSQIPTAQIIRNWHKMYLLNINKMNLQHIIKENNIKQQPLTLHHDGSSLGCPIIRLFYPIKHHKMYSITITLHLVMMIMTMK